MKRVLQQKVNKAIKSYSLFFMKKFIKCHNGVTFFIPLSHTCVKNEENKKKYHTSSGLTLRRR